MTIKNDFNKSRTFFLTVSSKIKYQERNETENKQETTTLKNLKMPGESKSLNTEGRMEENKKTGIQEKKTFLTNTFIGKLGILFLRIQRLTRQHPIKDWIMSTINGT